MANKKYIVGKKVYEETAERKVIVGGKVLEEATAAVGGGTGVTSLPIAGRGGIAGHGGIAGRHGGIAG